MSNRAAGNSGSGKAKRFFLRALVVLIAFVAIASVILHFMKQQNNPVPPINPKPAANGFSYPFKMVQGNPVFDLPAGEGRLVDMDTDTWFLEGVLEGKETGHRYSFIVIYMNSWAFGVYPYDFYSFTLYDLDKREYGTFTKYGRVKSTAGYLDLRFPLPEGDAVWTTAIDKDGYLIPFTYKVNFPGVDQNGNKMSLIADATAKNPPIPVGANVYNGKIAIHKQPNTFSYLQTGVQFEGTLSWGDRKEAVTGKLGHVDRQTFPKFVGVNGGKNGRNSSHEWRTFFLDNGLDFSSWRHFDRVNHNAQYASFEGATTYDAVNGARSFSDVVYETMSYVRTENHPVQPQMKPPAKVLYFPSRHRITSAALDLDLLAEPLIEAPLIAFPVEYMHGPASLSGTLAGKPFKGIGSLELTLAYYRDFELVKVLSDSIKYLPPEALQPNSTPLAHIVNTALEVGGLINGINSVEAKELANGRLRVEVSSLAEPYKGQMLQILNDLLAVM